MTDMIVIPRDAAFCMSPKVDKVAAKIAKLLGAHVEQTGRHPNNHYDYTTEADLVATLAPRMKQLGLAVQFSSFDMTTEEFEVKTKYNALQRVLYKVQTAIVIMDGESGQWICSYHEGSGANSDIDKGLYNALTGAAKYAWAKSMMVATGDDPETCDATEDRADYQSSGEPTSDHRSGGEKQNTCKCGKACGHYKMCQACNAKKEAGAGHEPPAEQDDSGDVVVAECAKLLNQIEMALGIERKEAWKLYSAELSKQGVSGKPNVKAGIRAAKIEQIRAAHFAVMQDRKREVDNP